MAEYWHCNECEILYDETDGDMDERMCNECLDKIYFEELKIKSSDTVKSVMGKVDKIINWVKGERRNPNIRRSSTAHYPDWDMKKKEYILPPKKRKNDGEPTTADEYNETWIKSKEKNDDSRKPVQRHRGN